jgi:16S rRNA U1498 N3-methylase RsmE
MIILVSSFLSFPITPGDSYQFSGSHLLRSSEESDQELRSLLIEGLSQSSVDYHLPEVLVCKYFNEKVYQRIFGDEENIRLIAHPEKEGNEGIGGEVKGVGEGEGDGKNDILPLLSASSLLRKSHNNDSNQNKNSQEKNNEKKKKKKNKILVAIGPEGGWTAEEISLYRSRMNFRCVSLGERVLRTDTAVAVVLGTIHQLLLASEIEP